LAFAVFVTLTPHRQSTPQNGLRHFSALPTHHPNASERDKEIFSRIIVKKDVSLQLSNKVLDIAKKNINK